MKDINLLQSGKAELTKESEFTRKVKVFSFVSLIVYCLIAVGIFSYQMVLKKSQRRLDEGIQLQKNKIGKFKQV